MEPANQPTAMDNMQIVAADNGRNRHGYPQGYHFVPDELELIRLLEDKLVDRSLPFPLANIFHNVKIRDFHPAQLYEAYKGHQESGYIYFFSEREYQSRSSKVRPLRAMQCGNYWKASGGGKELRRGGSVVGYKLTMVFYIKKPPGQQDDKTLWAMHEFTRIVGDGKKVADMALYRLYKMSNNENKEKNAAASRSNKSNATTSAKGKEVVVEEVPSPPSPPQHPYFAGPSTPQAHAYQQQAFCAPAEPSTSSWVRPAAGRLEIAGPPAATGYHQQQHMTFQYATEIADWDKRLPALGSPGPAAIAPASQHFGYQQTNGQHLVYHTNRQQMQTFPPPPPPASQHFGYQEAAGSLKNLPPSPTPLPAPGAEGYLPNEFDIWCETQRQRQQQHEEEDPQQMAAGASLSPTPDDIGVNDMLTDLMAETSDMSCTFEELIGIMEWPSPDQVDSSSINQQEQSIHSSQFTGTND